MFFSNNIEGIDTIRKKIPSELRFSIISELHYKQIFDEECCDHIKCIEMILTNIQNTYTVKVELINVKGNLCFDMNNGFGSGLKIDDLSGHGYEKNCRFRVSSFEQDNESEIFCERIIVSMI